MQQRQPHSLERRLQAAENLTHALHKGHICIQILVWWLKGDLHNPGTEWVCCWMTPNLFLPEFCHDLSSPALHEWTEDVVVPPTTRRWLVSGQTQPQPCWPSHHPACGQDSCGTVALAGDPDGAAWTGEGQLHPGQEQGVIRSAQPACQQPLAAEHRLSHQHPNESRFVVVLSSPASEECASPGRQVTVSGWIGSCAGTWPHEQELSFRPGAHCPFR